MPGWREFHTSAWCSFSSNSKPQTSNSFREEVKLSLVFSPLPDSQCGSCTHLGEGIWSNLHTHGILVLPHGITIPGPILLPVWARVTRAGPQSEWAKCVTSFYMTWDTPVLILFTTNHLQLHSNDQSISWHTVNTSSVAFIAAGCRLRTCDCNCFIIHKSSSVAICN